MLDLRCFLLPLTPLLFLLPGPSYEGTPAAWTVFATLVAWTLLYARIVTRDTNAFRSIAFHAIDVAIMFTIFGAALATAPSPPARGYSGVLLYGPFQPQTYTPLLMIGVLLGASRALVFGLISCGCYIATVRATGIHAATLIGAQRLPALLLALAIYLTVGAIVGLYATLVARLNDATRAAWRLARETGEVAGRRRVEAEVHDKILTPVRSIQRYLEAISPKLDAEYGPRVASAAAFLDYVLRRERANRGLTDINTSNLVDVVTATYWSHKVLDENQRLDALVFDPPLLVRQPETTPSLSLDAATDLTEILFHAIENAQLHARGRITVSLVEEQRRGGAIYSLTVHDEGPDGTPGDDRGQGLRNIHRRSDLNGWKCHFDRAEAGSRLTLTIPTARFRQPFWTSATSGLSLRASNQTWHPFSRRRP